MDNRKRSPGETVPTEDRRVLPLLECSGECLAVGSPPSDVVALLPLLWRLALQLILALHA